MKANTKVGSGVIACEEAFKRLVEGVPVVPGHVGIDSSKITAGIVSVEAGFDRGYLKKSRKAHQPLIAQIEAYRAEADSAIGVRSPRVQAIKRAKDKLASIEEELKLALEQRDLVLMQNLQLYERIRELEQDLARLQPKLGKVHGRKTH